ncbi:MAG: hypothetical protein H7Z14_13180 [Anaerolineae bacterium]|nr:hypothetical protein [Phycisphaerae bacterium]
MNRLSVARRAAMSRGWITESRNVQSTRTVRPHLAPVAAPADPNGVRAFAQQVALATTGSCLRYSQRLHLFALAKEAGISRFDANLIIAAIEHRSGKSRADVEAAHENRSLARPSILVSTAALLQVMILVVGWITLFR